MGKHRPVILLEYVPAHIHHIVRPDPDEEVVECGVMELAQGNAVLNHGIAIRFTVRDDVGGIEELSVPQPAQGALLPVSIEYSLPEPSLVESLPNDRRDVLSAPCILGSLRSESILLGPLVCLQVSAVIHRDHELPVNRVISYDEHGPHRYVLPGHDAMEVHQRRTLPHGHPEAFVLAMVWVAGAVAVEDETLRAHLVIVGAMHRGGDSKRDLGKDCGLEDALARDERDTCPLELEPLKKKGVGQDVAVSGDLFGQPVERSQAYSLVIQSYWHPTSPALPTEAFTRRA